MGPLTGLGGDLVIIDDPQKPIDAQSEPRRNSVNQWLSGRRAIPANLVEWLDEVADHMDKAPALPRDWQRSQP